MNSFCMSSSCDLRYRRLLAVYALLFDLLIEWAPDEATRHRILVENPVTLYGFAPSL